MAGLVEWPVPLICKIDDDFMTVPQEVLTSTMRANQKYFALTDANGKLAPRFIVVANLIAADGGKAIVNGNERVLRARFSDARFLWDQDRGATLQRMLSKLRETVFQANLGLMDEKIHRLEWLSHSFAEKYFNANPIEAAAAGLMAKADLASGMVFEFPELQGLMGAYYAKIEGMSNRVAEAIAEHYSPVGPNDRIPQSTLGKIVALADKLDTLFGFWVIEETPTGSKDPFALRRSALGVVRILLEGNIRLPLNEALFLVREFYDDTIISGHIDSDNNVSDLKIFQEALLVCCFRLL